ncbi:MAG TPA: aminoacyl-tRNA hydrolase [Candidatus Saccharimonadales bacterium]|nr:aminoacyl-tRNA hydrolase [Candidatus Saccharimonadales bacterium]
MGLIQKKPYVTSSAPAYTIGATKDLLIIGLGNPGKKFSATRHNAGFMALDYFAQQNDFPAWTKKKDLKCDIAISAMGSSRVILCKPATQMNLSGESAETVQHFYRIYNPQTLAVFDELAIPFGQLRTRIGGSDAGHNGVKSLIEHIGGDFGRLRIGINSELSKNSDSAAYVLKKFSKEERAELPKVLREANALITEYIFGDKLHHETRTVL